MSTVYDELTRQCQARYNGIRRKTQFFSTFAGGVIEALRESGFRLCAFENQPEYDSVFSQPDRPSPGLRPQGRRGNDNIELFFEQQDRDQCKVLIVPYRTDLPFLAKGRFVAQLGLELSRYCNDPDTLRQAMAVNAKTAFGSLLGGSRLPKLYLDSPPDIKPPGTMTFELRGARLVVAMNVLANLGKYRLSDFELDIDAVREDLQVYFYGLEKYLALLMKNFGGPVEMLDQPEAPAEGEPSVEDLPAEGAASAPERTEPPTPPITPPRPAEPLHDPMQPPPMAGAPLPQSLPPSGTMRLQPPPPPLAGAPLPPPPPSSPTGTTRLDQLPPQE